MSTEDLEKVISPCNIRVESDLTQIGDVSFTVILNVGKSELLAATGM